MKELSKDQLRQHLIQKSISPQCEAEQKIVAILRQQKPRRYGLTLLNIVRSSATVQDIEQLECVCVAGKPYEKVE